MSELNPQEMVDIITLDRIAEVLQLRNTADPDDARAEVIGDLHQVRNMLVHGPNMPQVNGPTARDVIDRALRLLTDLAELEMTSLGTANVRRIRSRATAGRVADILTRHAEEGDRLGQDDAPVRLTTARPDLAESAAASGATEVPEERATHPAEDRAMTPSSAGVSGELQRGSPRGESAMKEAEAVSSNDVPRPKGRPGRKPRGSAPVVVLETPDRPDPAITC